MKSKGMSKAKSKSKRPGPLVIKLPRLLTMHEMQSVYLEMVLRACKGNQRKAAEALDISEKTVWRMVNEIVKEEQAKPLDKGAA